MNKLNSPTRPASGRISSPIVSIALVLVIAAALVLLSRNTQPAVEPHPAIGNASPLLDLVTLISPDSEAEEEAVPLSGSPQLGRVTLLHFWGTWCPPCRVEYPELVDLVASLASKPQFQFISVSCEGAPGETYMGLRDQTKKYYQSSGWDDSMLTYADASGQTRFDTAKRLGRDSMAYPTTVLIDTEGKIAGVWEGYSPQGVQEMAQRIAELLRSASDSA